MTTFLELETHPDGTVGVNAIVTGNWGRLDDVFDPALGAGDASYLAFHRALVRDENDPTTEGANIEWDPVAGKPIWREGYEAIAEASPYAIDVEGAQEQFMLMTGTITLQSLANQSAGGHVRFFLRTDGSMRNINIPAGWVFMDTAAPANIAANKTAEFDIFCLGPNDSDVVVHYHLSV